MHSQLTEHEVLENCKLKMADRGRQGSNNLSSEGSLSSLQAIAGAVVNAIVQSLSSDQTVSTTNSSETRASASSSIFSAATSSPDSRISLPSTISILPPSSRPSAYERASDVRASKRPKFSAPTLFENVRTRCRSQKHQGQPLNVINYDQNVILLPKEFQSKDGDISIPRSGRRNKLGQAGLIGKVELNSNMTDLEVRTEICEVFATPMGLMDEDIKSGHLFPFSYLH